MQLVVDQVSFGLAQGDMVRPLVPTHHDHALGEWIGIRPMLDHVVVFAR